MSPALLLWRTRGLVPRTDRLAKRLANLEQRTDTLIKITEPGSR